MLILLNLNYMNLFSYLSTNENGTFIQFIHNNINNNNKELTCVESWIWTLNVFLVHVLVLLLHYITFS